MERCACFHRFVVLGCVSAFLSAGVSGAVQAAVLANAQPLATQTALAPPAASPSETKAVQSEVQQAAKTAEYTLSHDRYEKAVAYSRVAYALYFVSIGINVLALWMLLRLT